MYIKELKTVEFMFSKIHVDIRSSHITCVMTEISHAITVQYTVTSLRTDYCIHTVSFIRKVHNAIYCDA